MLKLRKTWFWEGDALVFIDDRTDPPTRLNGLPDHRRDVITRLLLDGSCVGAAGIARFLEGCESIFRIALSSREMTDWGREVGGKYVDVPRASLSAVDKGAADLQESLSTCDPAAMDCFIRTLDGVFRKSDVPFERHKSAQMVFDLLTHVRRAAQEAKSMLTAEHSSDTRMRRAQLFIADRVRNLFREMAPEMAATASNGTVFLAVLEQLFSAAFTKNPNLPNLLKKLPPAPK